MSRQRIEDSEILGCFHDAMKFRSQTKTLAGNLTLVAASHTMQYLDPGGAARNVVLPAEASSEGLMFIIVNTADADESLTVQSDTPATVEVVDQNEMGLFFCDGTTWRGLVAPATVGGVRYTDLTLEVINKTGSSIAADKLVAVSALDVTSGKPKIVLADADVAGHEDVWVTTAAIANNAEGVVRKAALSPATLDTSGATTAGDAVFLDVTAGGFAHAAPTGATARVHPVGMVVVKDAAVGQIFWMVGPVRSVGTNELQNAAITAGKLSANLKTGFIPLDITSLREMFTNDIGVAAVGAAQGSGGILAKDTTPILERVSTTTDKALRVKWAAANVDEVQFPAVPMPPDLDETGSVTVHLLAKMGGATDTPTIDVQAFDGIGDTEMGGTTAALSSTLAELSVTLAAADISGHPLGFLNISLVPGAHGTDTLELYAAWIEYTRKS